MNDQFLPGQFQLDTCASPAPLHIVDHAPRIAVVGAGLMGRWHAHAIRRSGHRVTAVVDSDLNRAKSLSGNAIAATKLDDVLTGGMNDGAIDAVHICTPIETHFDLVQATLNAGAHVLVEKPVTDRLSQTTELLDHAAQKGLYICPVHQFPFQRGVAKAAGFLKKLGSVQEIAFTICSGGGSAASGPDLDATVNDILPHPFSVMQQLWPETPLQPDHWSAVRSVPGNILVSGTHGDAHFTIGISMHARPTCCEMTIRCDKGTVLIDFFHGFAVLEQGNPSRWQKIVRPFRRADGLYLAASLNLIRRIVRREPAYPGLRDLIKNFYGAVAGKNAFPIDPAGTVAVARARAAVVEKAA